MTQLFFVLGSFLPYCCLIVLIVLLRASITVSWREAFLYALVFWGVFVLILTESLSLFHIIDFFPVFLSWFLVFFIIGSMLFFKKGALRTIISFSQQYSISFTEKIIICIIIIVCTVTAITAFLCPPNTWDSLSYHMARIAHWIQNRSVDFYPTHNTRQLVSPMWLEYAALQFQILSRGDYFANSIQWVSMVGSVIGVSLIAQYFGISFLGQLVSAVVVVTLPMGILQASSMQGDYATALWLVIAMSVILKNEFSWWKILVFSMSVGLAFLTKGTGFIFGIPLIVGFFIKVRFSIIKFCVFWIVVLLMMSGYFMRNYQVQPHSIFVASQVHGVGVNFKDISWSTIVANSIRNTGMHLGVGIKQVDSITEKGLYHLGEILKTDINDPKATFGLQELHISGSLRNEDSAINGLHFIVYIICFILVSRRRFRSIFGEYSFYLLGMFIALVLFVRWQEWSSRFHLPMFIFGAVFVGFICQHIRWRYTSVVVALLFFGMAVPYLVDGHPRHLLGKKSFLKTDRMVNLFRRDTNSLYNYSKAVEYVQMVGCQQIGLEMGGDSWDYTFYRLFNPNQDQRIRVEHVSVNNFSQVYNYPLGPFTPCAIVSIDNEVHVRIHK